MTDGSSSETVQTQNQKIDILKYQKKMLSTQDIISSRNTLHKYISRQKLRTCGQQTVRNVKALPLNSEGNNHYRWKHSSRHNDGDHQKGENMWKNTKDIFSH